MRRYTKTLGHGVAWLVVVAVLSYLYLNTQTVAPERHTRIIDNLRQLHQFDATLNQDFIKVRYGLLPHYDTFMDTPRKITAVQSRLNNTISLAGISQHTDIGLYLKKVSEVFEYKVELLEQLKSQMAIFKNSLLFLPIATVQLRSLALTEHDTQTLIKHINRLEHYTLIYNLTNDRVYPPQVEKQLQELTNLQNQWSAPLQEHTNNIMIHVRIVMEQKLKVDSILKKLMALPTSQQLDGLYNTYQRYNESLVIKANSYRLVLFLVSVLLLAYVGYILFRLRHSVSNLRRVEAELRSIFDNALDGIISIDAKGTIEHFNASAEKIFGHSSKEVIGQNIKILMPAYHSKRHDAYLISYLATGQAKIIGKATEVEGMRKDGSLFPLEISVNELWIGSQCKFTGIVRDISKRASLKRELAQYRNSLEELVIHRTHELAEANVSLKQEITEREQMEKQLIQAKESALQANSAKSIFLANMSHELRTPLNSIIGFAGIIKKGMAGNVNEEQVRQLQMVYDSAHHLLELINDILDLSKIEAGKLKMIKETFNLRSLLEELKEFMTAQTDSKGLSLSLAGHVPEFVHTDRGKLRQILLNLIGNAIKFTEQGSITLVCHQENSDVVFEVIDTGIGICKEDLGKVFDAFEQVDARTEREYEGTGLGLAISQRFVKLLGGEITVHSQPGKGSTFRIVLHGVLLEESIS